MQLSDRRRDQFSDRIPDTQRQRNTRSLDEFHRQERIKRRFVMSKILTATIVLALALVGSAYARIHYHHHVNRGHLGVPLGYQPQQPMTPQFNDPGPKLWVPQPGNAVEQLSPLMGAGQPDALGIK
jgi:hypothetical protein